MAIDSVIIAFSIVCAVCVISASITLAVMFKHDPANATEALKSFFEGGNALRIATVLVIIGTAAVLALSDKLSEGALALMSGVAGYVLGGISKPNNINPTTDA